MNETKNQSYILPILFSLGLLSCVRVQAQAFGAVALNPRTTLQPNRALRHPRELEGPLRVSNLEAQDTPDTANSGFNLPPLPDDIGAPGRRSGLGSRGEMCEEQSLTALAPIYPGNESEGAVYGQTISAHPSFQFYIPYQPPSTGEFVLLDAQGTEVYRTPVKLPNSPEVITVALSSKTSLAMDGRYRWQLKIYREGEAQAFSAVDGSIQRVELSPELEAKLAQATPAEQIKLYAANGIWYEALNTAAKVRRDNPMEKSWSGLLQAVDLGELASCF